MTSNTPVAAQLDCGSIGRTSSSPFINVYSAVDPTPYDINYPIQQRWVNLALVKEWILIGYSNQTGVLLANWLLLSNSAASVLEFVGNTGTAFPLAGVQNVIGVDGLTVDASGNTLTITPPSGGVDLHTAKWIVNSSANAGGNQTTITAAMAAASSGDTIMVMPGATGTYTENFTMKPGVNLTAWLGDSLAPTVTIIGKVTMTGALTSSISNIRIQTNSDFAISVTGSAASLLYVNNCYINCTNNTGINHSSSSASSTIIFTNCFLNKGTTGVSYYTNTSPGFITFDNCLGFNSGNSLTASTSSDGGITYNYCNMNDPITTSGTTAVVQFYYSQIGNLNNTLVLTQGSTAANSVAISSTFQSGSAAAITIAAGCAFTMVGDCSVKSSNTNPITGSGTINYSPITFTDTGIAINTSTQVLIPFGPEAYIPKGITFDNTNVLDNFVDKTSWTPTLMGATTPGTSTYTTQTGMYSRIGNMVFASGVIVVTAATGTGTLQIGNFPIISSSAANSQTYGSVSIFSINTWPLGTTQTSVTLSVGSTFAGILCTGNGITPGFLQLANTAWNIQFSIVYYV